MKTLVAVYDLKIGPVSFDFVVWLIKARIEKERIAAKALHVVVVPFAGGVGGMFRDKTALYDEAEMHWRLWNIVIPACQLAGASVTLATDWKMVAALNADAMWPKDWDDQTLRNRHHLIGTIIDHANSGAKVPMLRASEHARRAVRERFKYRPFVTLTMRRTYRESRNAVVEDWLSVVSDIERKGYAVEVIDDVSKALKAGRGFAEFSLDLRLALYESATFNLQSNNGTASLCWFSSRPYVMFDAGVGDTREEWYGLFVDQGLPWGESWPWATPKQRIVYERSTRAVLLREIERGLG